MTCWRLDRLRKPNESFNIDDLTSDYLTIILTVKRLADLLIDNLNTVLTAKLMTI